MASSDPAEHLRQRGDSRIGRRWNIDPIIKVWESSYSVFSNDPILMVDPNGADWYEDNKTHKATYFEGSDNREGFTWRGGEEYVFQGATLENVSVSATRHKLPEEKINPEFGGWGEVAQIAEKKLEQNINQINRSLKTGQTLDHIDIAMLEGKRTANLGGKNIKPRFAKAGLSFHDLSQSYGNMVY